MAKEFEIAFKLGAELESNFHQSFSTASSDFKELQKQVQNLSKGSGSADTTKPVRKDLQETQREFRKTESEGNNMVGLLKKAGTVLAGAFAVKSVIGFGKNLVNTFAEFEQGMANVRAVSGVTGEEFERLSAKAREMGERTSKSASEATEGLQYLALAGWNTDQMLEGIEPVLRLSEAGAIDLGRASDLATDSMAALGIEVGDLEGYLNKVAQTSRRSNTDIDALMEAMVVAGGTFSRFNVPLDEANAFLGILANRGTKGGEAGTALNAIMDRLTSGTGQAAKALDELGISAFDSEGNFKGMEVTMREIQERLSGMNDEQKAHYQSMIAGLNHGKSFEKMLQGLGSEYDDLKAEIQGADGALMEMAETQMDTFLGSMKLLESAIESAKINLGEKLAPTIRWVADGISEYLPIAMEKAEYAFQRASEFMQPFIDAGKRAFNFLKDDIAGTLKTIQSDVEHWVNTVWDTLKGDDFKGVFQSVSEGFKSAIPLLKSYVKYAQDVFRKLFSIMTEVGKYYRENILPVITNAIQFIAGTVVPKLVGAFQEWIPKAQHIIMGLADAFMVMWEGFIKPTLDNLLTVFNFVWPTIKDIVVIAIDAVKGVVGGLLTSLGGIIDFVVGVFTGDWGRAWEGVTNVFKGIMDGLASILKVPLNAVISLINRAIGGINDISLEIPDWVPEWAGGGQNFGMSIPEIPMLAKGAMVDRPTLAMVGEGGDREAVIPINNKPRSHALLDATNRMMGHNQGSSGNIHIDYNPTIIVEGGGPDVQRQVQEATKQSLADFERWFKQMMRQEKRLSFNG